MRTFLLSMLLAGLVTVTGRAAIDAKITFEEGIPKTFAACGNSELSLSTDRYKDGRHSLRWSWSAPARLTVSDYASLLRSLKARKSGLMVWIYNTRAVDDDLHFEFLTATGESEYNFDFHLDYVGWRACWIKYEDMEGSHASKSITRMSVRTPDSMPEGEIFLDRMTFTEFPIHVQVTPDQQIPNNNKHLTRRNLWHWARLWEWEQYESDIPLAEPSAEQIAELDEIADRVTEVVEMSRSSENYIRGTILPRALKTFEAAAIRRLPQGGTTGAPYLCNDECNRQKGELRADDFENMLNAFALSSYLLGDDSHVDDFFLVFDHAIDQGFAFGSGSGTNHHYGYSVRKIYDAMWLMRDEIARRGKTEEYVRALTYWSSLSEPRRPYLYGRDELLDSWHTLTMPRVISAMMQPTAAQRLQAMKSLSRWISGSLDFTPGTIGGIKIDGTTFHHGGFYPNYSTGAFAALGYFCKLTVGTEFQLTEQARRRLKHALMTLDFYTNLRSWGIGVSGRHPINKNSRIPDADVKAFGYLALQGDLTGSGLAYDPELAGAYLRLKGNDRKLNAALRGASPTPDPEGFRVLNYGAAGIHRRGSWMVTLKAYNTDVWCSEIYTKDNRYGRYQSYGTVQLFATGSPVSAEESGFRQEGWDWNRVPGATTVHLPFDQLNSPLKGTLMERSTERFSGTSSLEGRNGVLAFKLLEKDRPTFTAGARALKSVFCFDNRLVFLGSGITNDNAVYPTETTLFQLALTDPAEEIEFDNERYTDFPLSLSRSGAKRLALSDTKGNFYVVKNAPEVVVVKQDQESPNDKTHALRQGRFVVAYLPHGTAPQQAGYEYALYVQPTNKEINRVLKRDTYEVIRRDDTAHVVRDLESGITGYVCWAPYAAEASVAAIDAETIVMERTDTDGSWIMSVCTPDLGLTEKSYTTPQESQPLVKRVVLQGEWLLAEPNAAVERSAAEGRTELKVTCLHGQPVEFRLRQ